MEENLEVMLKDCTSDDQSIEEEKGKDNLLERLEALENSVAALRDPRNDIKVETRPAELDGLTQSNPPTPQCSSNFGNTISKQPNTANPPLQKLLQNKQPPSINSAHLNSKNSVVIALASAPPSKISNTVSR